MSYLASSPAPLSLFHLQAMSYSQQLTNYVQSHGRPNGENVLSMRIKVHSSPAQRPIQLPRSLLKGNY